MLANKVLNTVSLELLIKYGQVQAWTSAAGIFIHGTNIVDKRVNSAIFQSFLLFFSFFFRCLPLPPGKFSADVWKPLFSQTWS